jgi:HlyD family secretion protein
MRRFRWLFVLIAVVAVAAAVAAVRRNGGSATRVTVGAAEKRSVFRSTVTASGEIVATRYADIGSNVMGKIVSLRVAEGNRVKAGQVLAVIDPVQARAEVNAANALVRALEADAAAASDQIRSSEAERAATRARLTEAELTLKRAKELQAQALAPRADLDAAQAAFDAAQAQARAADAGTERAQKAQAAAMGRIAQARAQAARSQDILGKTEITAPIDGIVSRLQVREGEMVVIGIQNQPGTTLMTVSDLSLIDAEVKVAEADVLRLQLGQTASVVLEAIPGRTFTGKVVEIGASALPIVGTAAAAREFRVVVRLDAPDPSLRPGLTCDAEILTSERRDVVAVPLQSVVLRPSATAGSATPSETPGVFVVSGDRVRFTPVTTGIIGGLDIEVNGVTPGTPVVTGPYQALRELADGARIKAN